MVISKYSQPGIRVGCIIVTLEKTLEKKLMVATNTPQIHQGQMQTFCPVSYDPPAALQLVGPSFE
jgi:hypothetical protein